MKNRHLAPICLLILLFLAASSTRVHAMGGFTLGPGSYTGPDSDGVHTWQKVTIQIAPDGKLSAKIRDNVTEGPTDGGYIRIITYDITIAGVYDPETGLFSGDFSVQHEWDRQQNIKEFTSQYHHVGEDTHRGSFSGQALGGDSMITLTFSGAYNQNLTTNISQNGRDEGPSSKSFDLTHTVIFPVQGDIPIPENARPKENFFGAKFSDLGGEVEWRPDENEEAWRSAELGDILPDNAHIRTKGKDSTVMLSFGDMTTFVLKGDSEIILPEKPTSEGHIKLLWGNIKANIEKMAKDGSMEIEGSQAVMGIKGTVLVIEDDGAQSTLKVIEGEVAFTSKNDQSTTAIRSGEMITADANGAGEKTTFDVAQEVASWQAASPAAATGPKLPPNLTFLLLVGSGLALLALAVIAIPVTLFLRLKRNRGS